LASKENTETPSQLQPVVRREETTLESFASICSVLVIGLFVITFIFQNFEIPSPSMVKTLLIGDHVLVDRITLAPPTHWAPFMYYRNIHRGDIIVFFKPEEKIYLVKRVIGIPGDHIHLEHGVVYRNGVALKEPYATMPSDDDDPNDAYQPYRDDFPSVPPTMDGNTTATWSVDLPHYIQNGELVVPPGQYFAMGDSRLISLDSRYWGFVPRANILGRPLFIYWSFNTPADQIYKTSIAQRMAFMGHIILHFFDQTRWSRTFHRVQ
jgi:signal peptidase I